MVVITFVTMVDGMRKLMKRSPKEMPKSVPVTVKSETDEHMREMSVLMAAQRLAKKEAMEARQAGDYDGETEAMKRYEYALEEFNVELTGRSDRGVMAL